MLRREVSFAAFLAILVVLPGHISARAAPGREEDTFQDCADCPVLIRLPAGGFHMGPAAWEEEAEGVPRDWQGISPLQGQKEIEVPFAIGKFLIRRGEFRRFVEATGHGIEPGCVNYYGSMWKFELRWNWSHVSFEQTDDHPVVCVSWFDALRYTEWLTERTGKRYRLLTELEWEYAARAGTKTRRYWGDDPLHTEQCSYANGADRTYLEVYSKDVSANGACADGYAHTSPVGRFQPNQFSLFDMQGNVTQWVQDCMYDHTEFLGFERADNCPMRVLKGGSWADPSWGIRAADKYRDLPTTRCMGIGFRVARDIE